jgi:diguanylate cyclase (GGDEF)-like protein
MRTMRREPADVLGEAASPRRRHLLQLWRAPDRVIESFRRFVSRSSAASRPALDSSTLILGGQIVLGAVIAVATGLLILHLRTNAFLQADREQRNLALVLANQAERAFEAVELVQTDILDRLRDDGVRTTEAFRQRMSGTSAREELAARGRALPQLEAILINDAAGNLINSSQAASAPASVASIADGDLHEALKAHPEQSTFIADPVQSGSTDEWTLYIARKVSGPDGELLGVVQAGLSLHLFEELYRSVAPSADSSIALFRQDGHLLTRYPRIGIVPGKVYEAIEPFRDLDGSGSSLVVRQISPFDGRDRLVAARRLENYPVVVTVSATVSSILTAWRNQTIYLVGSAIVLESLVVGLGLLMLRQLRGQRMLEEARAATANAEVSRLGAEAELAVSEERERTERELAIQNARFVAALNNTSQALCLFDSSDRLLIGNGRHAEMFGMHASSVMPGATLEGLLGQADGSSNLSASDLDSMRIDIKEVKAAGKRHAGIHKLSDGRVIAMNFVPVQNEDWLITFDDITEQRLAADKIAHMANHDALTGLPNRTLFRLKLSEALDRSERGQPCAVLYLDLDRFKAVNDTLGHPVGDALLRDVTLRLLEHTRKTDTVARLGGDEFAVVQASIEQPQDALSLATRLIEALAEPYEIGGHQVMVGTSVGIALVPIDGDNPDQILKNADMALYRAKAEGRGRYCFFTPEMDARMQARRALEMDLRKALSAGEFELFYQPLINLKSGSVIGFEALMRWFHPRRGMISPADFIPLAEEIGLLVPLGEWALRQACSDAVAWPAHMKVAVNVSATQFASRTLVDDVASALAASGLEPERLELEVTETVLLDEADAILITLRRLRDLRIGIAMDDFGTGYSSLNYLRRFPFSKVKIDRSFIEGLGKGGDCEAIVAAVIDLCTSLGMIVLAEGVETEEQLQLLRAAKCGEAQGYLFSRPRPASEVAALYWALTDPGTIEIPGGA